MWVAYFRKGIECKRCLLTLIKFYRAKSARNIEEPVKSCSGGMRISKPRRPKHFFLQTTLRSFKSSFKKKTKQFLPFKNRISYFELIHSFSFFLSLRLSICGFVYSMHIYLCLSVCLTLLDYAYRAVCLF